MNKTKYIFGFYALLSIAVIWVKLLGLDNAENFLKPLLMPTLIVGYLWLKTNPLKKYDYIIIISLVFSTLGDSFLMPYFNMFLAGLGSFLIVQILYITTFTSDIKKPLLLTKNKIALSALSFVYYIFLVIIILWNLEAEQSSFKLITALVIYATSIFAMFITAVLRNSLSKISYTFILIGCMFFLVSDSLIAINKFVETIHLSSLWIMSTYSLAQGFIIYGSLKRLK